MRKLKRRAQRFIARKLGLTKNNGYSEARASDSRWVVRKMGGGIVLQSTGIRKDVIPAVFPDTEENGDALRKLADYVGRLYG
jgi:hypothetical protein